MSQHVCCIYYMRSGTVCRPYKQLAEMVCYQLGSTHYEALIHCFVKQGCEAVFSVYGDCLARI